MRSDAGAPWSVRFDALVWWHRASPAAAAALVPELRGHRVLPLTAGAVVRYRATPVGPYDELLAVPGLVLDGLAPAGHVPFMAVDSVASVRAGRRNWALPKQLAAFDWEADLEAVAVGPDLLAARVRAVGPRLPGALAGRCRQKRPSGASLRFVVAAIGRVAPARAEIEVGTGAPGWLASGRHPALVVRGGRMRVGRPAAD